MLSPEQYIKINRKLNIKGKSMYMFLTNNLKIRESYVK